MKANLIDLSILIYMIVHIPRIPDPSSQTQTLSLLVGEFSEEHSLYSAKDLILQGHKSHVSDLSIRLLGQNIEDTEYNQKSYK